MKGYKKQVSFGTSKYEIAGLDSLTEHRPVDTPYSHKSGCNSTDLA